MVVITEEFGNEAFYRKAITIVNESEYFRGAAKTPALILPSERETKERKEYYNALIKKINERKIKVMYLFSLPRTEEAIIEYVKKKGKIGWDEIKENWQNLLRLWGNVFLGYVEHDDFISCIIGDHHTLIGWKGKKDKKIAAITYMTNEMTFYRTVYDDIFKEATFNQKDVIEKIEKKLKRLNLI